MVKKMSEKEYKALWKGADKDPEFKKYVKELIKVTTGTYKLKDYGLDKL